MSHTQLIYTVGHSNHTTKAFVDLLCRHHVALVADVRSQPYSRWAPQFNRETLRHSLQKAGITYRFFGDVLGGRPSDMELYTAGLPDYRRMEQTDAYRRGIERVLELARTECVAMMCGEADYQQCHRHLLIAQTLLRRGVNVVHIKPDGRTVQAESTPEQLSLF